jgi:hypothetical protein
MEKNKSFSDVEAAIGRVLTALALFLPALERETAARLAAE